MAEGGYDRDQFVDNVSEEHVCSICQKVAKGPNIIDCCEALFCQVCIETILKDKKPCPNCGKAEFKSLISRRFSTKIEGYRVYCSMKDKGCNWEGKLKCLVAHLDPKQDDCLYTECPKQCNQAVKKADLEDHLQNKCPKRDYSCEYCTFKSTYEIVSTEHFPQCEQFRSKCCDCGEEDLRINMSDHLKECRLLEVECKLRYAGCEEKFPREQLEDHMAQSMQKHVTLLADMTLRMRTTFNEKLRDKDEMIQELKQALRTQETQRAKERDDDLKMLEQQVQETAKENDTKLQEKEEKIQQMEQDLQTQETQRAQQRKEDIKKIEDGMQKMSEEKSQQMEVLKEEMLAVHKQSQHDMQTELEARDSKITELEEKLQAAIKQTQKDLQNDIAMKTQQLEASTQEKFDEIHEQLKEKEADMKLNIKAMEDHMIEKEATLQMMVEKSESNMNETLAEVRENMAEDREQTKQQIEHNFIRTNAQIITTNSGVQQLAIKIEQNDANICQLQDSLFATHTQLEDVKTTTEILEVGLYKDKEQMLKLNSAAAVTPFYIEMADVSLMTFEKPWLSPYLHTHPHGYKFAIGVVINGDPERDQFVQITTSFWVTKGEFDAHLRWPAKVQFRLELLDQYGHQEHIVSHLKQFDWFKISHPRNAGPITDCSISRVDLQLKYLRADCLRFRISEISVTRAHSLHNDVNASQVST